MITKTKQNWAVGATVKVGFMSLVVRAAIATPGDDMPDVYILANAAGTQLYKFVPYFGVEKLDLVDARELIVGAKLHAERIAASTIAKAQREAAAISAINDLIFA